MSCESVFQDSELAPVSVLLWFGVDIVWSVFLKRQKHLPVLQSRMELTHDLHLGFTFLRLYIHDVENLEVVARRERKQSAPSAGDGSGGEVWHQALVVHRQTPAQS